MQTGEYITQRLMVDIIYDLCQERGITLERLSDDWLLELTKNGQTKRILGYKFSLNDSVASSIAGDKVAAHLLLQRAGVASVPHVLLRPPVRAEQKAPLLEWEQGIVVKPLDGSGGHGVRLFQDVAAAIDWIESTDHPAWAAAPFIDIVREIRVVLLDGQPLITYEKQAVVKDSLKMFNLGLGATPKDIVPDEALLSLAAEAQKTLGLRLSAVDIVEAVNGERMVLEVNSGFMMEYYMRHSSTNLQRCQKTYARIIDSLFYDQV
jgi:glutathione synthase/RimK-type ligase-like ATP-grasp enzyme